MCVWQAQNSNYAVSAPGWGGVVGSWRGRGSRGGGRGQLAGSSCVRFLITSSLSIVEAYTETILKNTNVYQKPPNDTDDPNAARKVKYHSIVENRTLNALRYTTLA